MLFNQVFGSLCEEGVPICQLSRACAKQTGETDTLSYLYWFRVKAPFVQGQTSFGFGSDKAGIYSYPGFVEDLLLCSYLESAFSNLIFLLNSFISASSL
jgi:hypothetical protein